jgi:hypothetical protein
MIFYAYFETEDDFGRFRRTVGFRTEAAREQWVLAELRLSRAAGDFSDLEEWEADESEWPSVRIIG